MDTDNSLPEPRTLSDVREEYNFIERALAGLSPQDELTGAILRNNRLLLDNFQQQSRISGGVVNNTEDRGAFSIPGRGELPEDAIGRVARDINPNDTGPATFQINGTIFYAFVENDDDETIQAGEAVRVIGGENLVTTDSAGGSFQITAGGGNPDAFRYQGTLYEVPTVTDSGENVQVSNQSYVRGTYTDTSPTLNAGETKEFARIEPDNDEILLLKYTNATALSDARYDYYVDVDYETDPDLSGHTPWATPPDLFSVSPNGYRLVEDYVYVEISEQSGSNSYNDVSATLTGIIVEVA